MHIRASISVALSLNVPLMALEPAVGPQPEAGPQPLTAPVPEASNARVLKNAMVLVVAQIVTIPLSIAINAVMARYLGPSDFGYIYVATTFASFAFLIVEWGQVGSLPAQVAIDRSRAGALLGTALWWRVGGAVVAAIVLSLLAWVLRYQADFRIVLGLVILVTLVGSLLAACQDVIRGFERTDIAAYSQVLQQVLTAALVIPVLVLGFHLRVMLLVQAFAGLVLLGFVWTKLKPVGVGTKHWDRREAKVLRDHGYAFLVMGLTIALQPNIDAIFISKLARADVVGWHAASRKLIGMVIFPATALASALYPTLSRLANESVDEFKSVAAEALTLSSICVVPVALGCLLYPDIGVRIFSRESFGPAEQNVRFMAPFVFLLYFSMVLGTALGASGKQKGWAAAQAGCLIVSVVLDPLLIPWFQARTGNGGLGLCVASSVSEALMVGAGIYLAPKGLFTFPVLRRFALTFASGGAMIVAAKLLHSITPFVAAPVAVLAYLAMLVATGGLDRQKALQLKAMFSRRFSRS